jgi:hypothetical protein
MQPAARFLNRRAFSLAARVRSLAHTARISSHNVQGYPVSHQGAQADWGKQFRHVGDAGMVYVPLYAVTL